MKRDIGFGLILLGVIILLAAPHIYNINDPTIYIDGAFSALAFSSWFFGISLIIFSHLTEKKEPLDQKLNLAIFAGGGSLMALVFGTSFWPSCIVGSLFGIAGILLCHFYFRNTKKKATGLIVFNIVAASLNLLYLILYSVGMLGV